MAETLDGFALRLRELRKQMNLSQTEVGQLAELHYTHIGRFERGKLLDAFMVKKQLRAMARDGRAQR